MADSSTLQLPEDLARLAREAARRDGRSLEDTLGAWLVRAAEVTGPTIATPYGNEAAAQILLDVLRSATADASPNQHPYWLPRSASPMRPISWNRLRPPSSHACLSCSALGIARSR